MRFNAVSLRSPIWGSAAFILGVAVVLLLTTVSLARNPLFAVAAVILLCVIIWPSTGFALAMAVESLRLVPLLMGVSSTTLSLAVTASLVVGAASRAARQPLDVHRFLKVAGITALIVGPGLLIGLFEHHPLHVLSTVNLLIAPFVGYACTRNSGPEIHRNLMRFVIVLLAANAVASVWEVTAGVGGLVAEGLAYGTTVRQIDGVLRAPGLTSTSAIAGLFAAAVLMWLIVGLRSENARVGYLWSALGIASGATVLVLSTSRSGMILVAVMALAMVIISGPRPGIAVTNRVRRMTNSIRVLMVFGVFAIPIALVQYGAGSSDSLFDRMEVWNSLLKDNLTIFGMGAGSVGASSYSAYNKSGGVFVDNSWLSVLLQYGIVGGLAACAMLVATILRLLKRRRVALHYSGAAVVILSVVLAIAMTAVFVEVLDYVAVMLIVGCILSQHTSTPSTSTPSRRESRAATVLR